MATDSFADPFAFGDEIGPSKIVYLQTPSVGLRAIVVIDNVAAGPAIGGTRMAPDVSVNECFRLARAMTLKNAACGLRHGGAKSVIFANPAMPRAEKEQLIRAFATAIAPLAEYIPGPDMGTDETAMGWIHDEIGRAVGLPAEIGGIPLDAIGATGFGVAISAEVAAPFAGLSLQGARVVVQGFGAVGEHAARFLEQKGARLVGVADIAGAVIDRDGLDIEALARLKRLGKSVVEYGRGRVIANDALVAIPCDIWVPAARPDALRADNAAHLDCKLVVQGANVPATREAELIMFERGIVSVPDFIANAGGVVAAAVEHSGGTTAMALKAIEEKVGGNTRLTLENARGSGTSPVEAATRLAVDRLRRMMSLRRWR
ncbi:Glu/Leu/Phe/Val family dehydrogenase [Methylocystis sp. S23]